jgi:hypothetical protein
MGRAVSLNSSMKARTMLWVEEPLVENATVRPLVSCSVRIGDVVLAYQ